MTPSLSHLILGVDPGLSGALALYDPVTRKLEVVIDMPTRPKPRHETKREIDTNALAYFLDTHALQIRVAIIEDVHSMPDQGVASTFTFGKATGIILGACAAFYIPTMMVAPATWKSMMRVTHDKATSLAKAKALFPDATDFERKKDDGRAEATLLAVYGGVFWKARALTPVTNP